MAPYPVPFSFQELIDGFIVHFDIAVHVLPGDRDDRASLLALEIGQAVHKTVTDFMASTGGPPINIFLRDGAQLYPFTVRKSHNLQETLRTFAAMVGTFDRPLRVTTCGDYVIDPNLTVEQSELVDGMVLDVLIMQEVHSYTSLFGTGMHHG